MMVDLLGKVMPYLETFRGWLEIPSNWIVSFLDIPLERASWIVFGIVAFLIGRWLFNLLYTDTKGRTIYLLIIVAVIFWVLKYL